MALIGTVGPIRTGKTAENTLLALIEAEKLLPNGDYASEVHVNFPITHKRIKLMKTVDDFMNLEMDEVNGLAVIQEFQVWIESRLSGKEITRAIDKTVLQSGKLGFDILWDAQLSSSIDKRARFNTLDWISTRRKLQLPNKDKAFIFRYIYLSNKLQMIKFHNPSNPDKWDSFKKNVLDKYDTRAIAELKRSFDQAQKEGDKTNEEYHKTQTETINQPDGDQIDKLTPQIQDRPNNMFDMLEKQGMEIVTS